MVPLKRRRRPHRALAGPIGSTDTNSSRPSSRRGARRDHRPVAILPSVRHLDEQGRPLDRTFLGHEGVSPAPVADQLPRGRPHVTGQSAAGQTTEQIGHRHRQPHARDVHERPAGELAHVDHPVVAVHRHRERPFGPEADAELSRQSVSGSGRHDTEHGVPVHQRRSHFVDGAVAPPCHDRREPPACQGRRKLPTVTRSLRERHLAGDAGVRAALPGHLGQSLDLPPAGRRTRGRVDDERQRRPYCQGFLRADEGRATRQVNAHRHIRETKRETTAGPTVV